MFSLGRKLAEGSRAYRAQRQDEDIQRLGTPLEVALDAITASGRGIARMGREAASGNNPLGYRDQTGRLEVPFVSGAQSTRSSWRETARMLVPKFDVTLPTPPVFSPSGAMLARPSSARFTGGGVADAAGTAADVGLDPATYLGVGAVTRAGHGLRAAEVGVKAAELELAGARSTREALAATRALRGALDKLTVAQDAARAEGTLLSRGRAAVTFAGRPVPGLTGEGVIAPAQRILGKVQTHQLVRGLSNVFQPPEMRVDPAIRARGYRVEAAAAVGRRDAARALQPLIHEYKPLVRAMGGDAQAVDDALSSALERSQGQRFDKPLDFLTEREREQFWSTGSADVKKSLEAEGERRAIASVPRYLSAPERSQWRQATRDRRLANELAVRLEQPVEFTEQLAQKHLSRSELRRLNMARERARKADDAFMRGATAEPGAGTGLESFVDAPATTAPGAGARVEMPPQPMKFDFWRNTERAPKLDGFDQHIEPSGRYMIAADPHGKIPDKRWEAGSVEFKNPLRIEWGGRYGSPDNWKAALSKRYGGKTGKALSRAIVSDGFDAIITHDKYGPQEVVDLTGFPGFKPKPAAAPAAESGAMRPMPRIVQANPNDVRTVTDLEQLAVKREREAARISAGRAYGAANAAHIKARQLMETAQKRAHAQALQNSILTARRAYFRGATPEAAKVFGDYAEQLVHTVNGRNASMFLETSREGVRVSELADPLAYMLHATTPEAQRAIIAEAVASGEIPVGMGWREFTEKHGSQLVRKLRMTAVEANELGRAGRLSITGNKPVGQFFYTNPLIAQVMREGAAAQQQAYARHLRELAKLYGRPTDAAPRGWRTVPNDIIGIGENVAFEPEIADHLTRYRRIIQDPAGVLAAWDRLQQIWKQWTLGIYPVYHTRNEIGDLINGVLLGGGDLKHAGYTMDELMQGTSWAQRIGRHADDGKSTMVDGRAYRPGEMRDEAEALGVIDSGQLRQTSERLVLGPDAKRAWSVRGSVREAGQGKAGIERIVDKATAGAYAAQRRITDNSAIDLALAVGDMREQAMRLLLYIDRRHRGWSPEAAALWTKKHLIDYGQHSDTERGLFQRVIPFYMWTRHNAPLQLEYLFAKPGVHATTQHLREAAAGDEPLGTGSVPLPSFLQSGLPVRSGTNAEGNPQFTRLEGLLPTTDAMKPIGWADMITGGRLGMGDEAARDLTSRVSPFITTPFEHATNIDLWRSRPNRPVPIEQFDGEEGTFLGTSIRRQTINDLQLARPLTELNRLNPLDVFGTDTKASVFGELQDYPALDEPLRWANLVLGRSYAVDEGREAGRWSKAQAQVLRSIAQQAAEAEAKGQTARAARYMKLYERLLENPESITPDMRR